MPGEWRNKCGAASYRFWEDGRIEVQGYGFPAWDANNPAAKQIAKSWSLWGGTVQKASKLKGVPVPWIMGIMHIESAGNPKAAAACEPVYCPALWNRGACASQGGPEIYCAAGLMAFISQTAAGYGKTLPYYMEHPDEQIVDGADVFAKGIARNNGDTLAAAKQYNGGSVCSGGGLVGMGGQANYVEKFIYAVNTFVNLGLAPVECSGMESTQGLLALAAFGFLGYVLYQQLDQRYGLTKAVGDRLG